MNITRFRNRLSRIVFGVDTPAGKTFDVILLLLILTSVSVVVLETVPAINAKYDQVLTILEWSFTILFTFEYILRLWISRKPLAYAFSFWGIIDFLSTIPAYLSLFISGSSGFAILRLFRLLRAFRVFKLTRYNKEGALLMQAIVQSGHKLTAFMSFIFAFICIIGSLMYFVEGGQNGFTSIPQSIYWVIVTITTVGFGDITPGTNLGKIIASVIMLLGYAVIAVPTGIVSAEIKDLRED